MIKISLQDSDILKFRPAADNKPKVYGLTPLGSEGEVKVNPGRYLAERVFSADPFRNVYFGVKDIVFSGSWIPILANNPWQYLF